MVTNAAISQAIMFVSRNAVTHAFAAGLVFDPHSGTRYWATGPGTQQALLDQGVFAERIDAPPADAVQFDTEALWQLVKHRVLADQQVLILRGADADNSDSSVEGVGRDWLMQQLQQASLPVKTLAVYQRVCPRWDDAQRARASNAVTDGSVWVFTSSQALAHVKQLLPSVKWHAAMAIATHDRIAQTAQQMGIGKVVVCKPAWRAVLSSLESLP